MPSTDTQPHPRKYLRLANAALAGSTATLVLTVLIAYPYAQRFGLGTQIAAHIGIPVAAGIFKLGYIVRLASFQALDALPGDRS